MQRPGGVEYGSARHLPVAPDRQLVFRLALARAVDGEGGYAAAEKQVLGGPELLLGRVEARDQDHEWMRATTGRPAQNSCDRGVVERYLDTFTRRFEQWERLVKAPDGTLMRP